jgi:cobalt-zinc-cadmium efflux system outer membrane protein
MPSIKICLLLWFIKVCVVLRAQAGYTLQQSLNHSISQNAVLRSEQHRVQMAEADLVTARQRPNPILNNQSLQLVKPTLFPANVSWNDGRTRQIWWQLTKPMLWPGVRNNKIQVATDNIKLEQYAYSETQNDKLLAIANMWIDAWLATKKRDNLLQLRQSAGEGMHDTLKEIESREVSPGEMKIRIARKQLELQLKHGEMELQKALLDLQLETGTPIAIDTSFTSLDAFLNRPELMKEQMLQRPDVALLKASVESAGHSISLQRSLAWPTPELGFIFNPQNTIPYAGFFGTIQIPLFARNEGEIKKSGILKMQAEEALSAHSMRLNTEFQNVLNGYKLAAENYKAYHSLVAEGAALLSSETITFRAGKLNAGEYLEAQKIFYELLDQYCSAQAEYLRYAVQLMHVTGSISQFAEGH